MQRRPSFAPTYQPSFLLASLPTACSASGGWIPWPRLGLRDSPSGKAGKRGTAAISASLERRRFRCVKTRPLDLLTAFGALAVTAMMLFYALERRSPIFVLAFALA